LNCLQCTGNGVSDETPKPEKRPKMQHDGQKEQNLLKVALDLQAVLV